MAGFTLEGKPWYYGIGIGVVLAAGIVFAADYFLIEDVKNQIKAAEAQIKELDTKIEQGRSGKEQPSTTLSPVPCVFSYEPACEPAQL